jgi:uncharacterized protein
MNKSRLFFSFALIVFLFQLAVLPQTGSELADYVKGNYTKREVYIPMRDGVRLFTAVYEPKDKTRKYPVLLNRTPYAITPYGEDKFKSALGPSDLYAREGYIFVYQDVRGKWMSEGEFMDVRPDIENQSVKDTDESTDTFDTVEWLLKNAANNNGRVGIYGISYPGFTFPPE